MLNSGRLKEFCFVLAAILFIISLTPAAAGTKEAHSEEDILLRMQTLPNPIQTGVEAQVNRKIVREFAQKFPQYKLIPFTFPEIEGMAMDQGPLMSIATGVPPHGIYVNFRQSSTYINHGFLAPLEILLARLISDNPRTRQTDKAGNWLADPKPEVVEDALQRIKERVVGPAWPVVYRMADTGGRKGVPGGKHVWAMPFDNLVRALLYRKDVFNRAGLDPERPPRTWKELMEFSRQIRAAQSGHFGIMFITGPVVSWSAYSFLVSKGVRYVERNEEGEWRAAFNTMEAAEALYYILRLVHEEFETEDGRVLEGVAFAPMGGGKEMRIKWNRGEIGMKFTYLSYERAQDINPAMVGVAPVPTPPEGRAASELNCRMLGTFSGSSPQQQLGVMRYIWFLTGRHAEELRTRSFVDAGYGEFLEPEVLKRYGYEDVARRVPEAWSKTIETAFESGVPEPYGKNTQMIYRYVSEPINWTLENAALLNLPKDEALSRIKHKLDEGAARVNEHMLGELTKRERMIRYTVGGIALVIIIVLFVTTVTFAWRAFTRQEEQMGDRPSFSKLRYAYLMLLPGLALVFFVRYLPLILGIPLALLDYELAIESEFAGLGNFAKILYDPRFWASMGRTFYYALLVVGLGFWPPILVAILLDEVPTKALKYFFRTIFYLPTIVSGIIMVFLWRQFYDPSESGFLNQIVMSVNYLGPVGATLVKIVMLLCWLSLIGFVFSCAIKLKELSWPVRAAVGAFAFALLAATIWPLVREYMGPNQLVIEAQNLDPELVSGWNGLKSYLGSFVGQFNMEPLGWIEDPGMAMICVVIPMVWASAGPGCIIYLAALKTVPEDLVEAATIDGAGIIQRISYITLPRIKFLILINLLGAVIGGLKGGASFIMVLTGGGPSGATRTLGLDIFQRAWMELDFSVGAAMGWVLGAMVIVLTCFQLRRMSRATFRTAAQAEAEQENPR
ncbi:MAG: extracellular solute-binding protein [Planctomycetes bacterium]|nr:extracellular solute-binding protein [Planctomycetota bacterium]